MYYLKISVVGLFILVGSCKNNKVTLKETGKPNIVIIYVDDLGYGDLSSYGGTIPTPHIDKIGEEGIRFTDFHVAAPACTPSRYALLTGAYPHRSHNGLDWVIYQWHDGYLNSEEKILPEYLKEHGYNTALLGKWHLGGNPMDYGFDYFAGHREGAIGYYNHSSVMPYTKRGTYEKDWYINNDRINEEGYTTDLITDHSLKIIDKFHKEKEPFFIYLSYNAPHFGQGVQDNAGDFNIINVKKGKGPKEFTTVFPSLEAPQKYLDKFEYIENVYERYYHAMVSCMDDNIGRFWSYLDKKELLDNTMIWFISDNGAYSDASYSIIPHASNGVLRGVKGTHFEGGIRVPALMCFTGKIDKGQVSDQFLVNADLFPTIAHMIGFEEKIANITIDGIDIYDHLLTGRKFSRDFYWYFRGDTNRTYRLDNYKIYGEYLFDLEKDMSESNNLRDSLPEIYQNLSMRYDSIRNTMKKYGAK